MNTQQIIKAIENLPHTTQRLFLDRISWNKLAYDINPEQYPEILMMYGIKIYKVDVSGDLFVIGN